LSISVGQHGLNHPLFEGTDPSAGQTGPVFSLGGHRWVDAEQKWHRCHARFVRVGPKVVRGTLVKVYHRCGMFVRVQADLHGRARVIRALPLPRTAALEQRRPPAAGGRQPRRISHPISVASATSSNAFVRRHTTAVTLRVGGRPIGAAFCELIKYRRVFFTRERIKPGENQPDDEKEGWQRADGDADREHF
jgi:hypothetical protein